MQMQYALILGAVSIHYCSFLLGHATSFLRLYRISSHLHTPTSSSACFYGACYRKLFTRSSSSASFHCACYQAYNTITQRQLHCACCFKPMTKGHQPDLQPMTKGYWWQLLPSLPNWHPHQLNARCAIYAIFASLAPPHFFLS